MEHINKRFSANANINDKITEFNIFYSSQFTLEAQFPHNTRFTSDQVIKCLKIEINNKFVPLSTCKIHMTEKHEKGILYFTEKFYDFNVLFNKGQIIEQKIFQYDEKQGLIERDFNAYTLELKSDLHKYQSFFDTYDINIANEPQAMHDFLRSILIDTEGSKFTSFFLKKIDQLEVIIKEFKKPEHKSHGHKFRKEFMSFIIQSPFMRRTNEKPRGYAGDSQMMYMIYQNEYEGNSTFAQLLHKISVEHPAAQAVRNRKKIITDKIREDLNSLCKNEKINILSVACGPACELEELILEKDDFNKISITLLDQDKLALNEARETVKKIEKKFGGKLDIIYLEDSISSIIKDPKTLKSSTKFDFIYSMGLFDYLASLVAKSLLTKLFDLLNKHGRILVGNYHYNNKSRRFLQYWHDWTLVYRNEKEMLTLIEHLNAKEVDLYFEETQSQMFLELKKA